MGDETALNAMPYRYIGFFERVKDGVRREWDPNRVYGPRDPTGGSFGYKDRMTVLKVTLDRRGKLLDATVVSSCGLGFLDDEAKRAMWAASPFVNPPEGLVAGDGRIRFEFGFVFLLSSAKHKLFWRLE
jgi:TonB family protein